MLCQISVFSIGFDAYGYVCVGKIDTTGRVYAVAIENEKKKQHCYGVWGWHGAIGRAREFDSTWLETCYCGHIID